MEQSINAYGVLLGKREGKRTSGRPRRRWEDNFKIDLREVGCDPGEWIDLAEDTDQWRAYVRAVMTSRFLKSHLVSLVVNIALLKSASFIYMKIRCFYSFSLMIYLFYYKLGLQLYQFL